MKHAYLIATNANWKLLNLLVETLDEPENAFYVLIDKKTRVSLKDILNYQPKWSKIYEAPPLCVNWGGYSQILGTINLLKAAIPGNYDYYHYMQGSDFPIKSAKEINIFFEKNQGKEFVNFAPINYNFAKWKCEYRHILVDNPYYRYSTILKSISHGIVYIQSFLGVRHRVGNLYHGSALFSITHNLAKFILENELFIRRSFRHSIAADEVFVQTLLMKSQYRDHVFHFEQDDGNVYYIDWSRREGSSPKTFDMTDLSRLMSLPEQYCYARKFSDENIDVCEKIVEFMR